MSPVPVAKRLLRPCPICDHSTGDVLHTQRFAVFDDYPLPDQYDVVACTACGMVFADTPATAADYERYYTSHSIYLDAAISLGSDASEWDVRRQTDSVERLARIAESKSARILDIGCANGGLLQRFHEAGFFNLVGVDPASVCVANTRARGIEAWQGTLSALPAEVGFCDLVILNSVLEHVFDVKGAVQAMISVCSPEGKLFLEVPDAQSYRHHIHAPFQEFNTEHINHFSPAAMDRLLAQFGFSCSQRESAVIRKEAGFASPYLDTAYSRSDAAGPEFASPGFRSSMEDYIEKSAALMAGLNRQIEAVVAQSKELIVWGTGQLAMKLLCESALARARIVACVDSNRVHQGKRLRGIRVLKPEEMRVPNVPVVLATLLHIEPIRARIQALGWNNPVITLSSS